MTTSCLHLALATVMHSFLAQNHHGVTKNNIVIFPAKVHDFPLMSEMTLKCLTQIPGIQMRFYLLQSFSLLKIIDLQYLTELTYCTVGNL